LVWHRRDMLRNCQVGWAGWGGRGLGILTCKGVRVGLARWLHGACPGPRDAGIRNAGGQQSAIRGERLPALSALRNISERSILRETQHNVVNIMAFVCLLSLLFSNKTLLLANMYQYATRWAVSRLH
jgi:hypothetical protein